MITTKIRKCPRCEEVLTSNDHCSECNYFIYEDHAANLTIPIDLVPMAKNIQNRLDHFFNAKKKEHTNDFLYLTGGHI